MEKSLKRFTANHAEEFRASVQMKIEWESEVVLAGGNLDHICCQNVWNTGIMRKHRKLRSFMYRPVGCDLLQ